MLMSTANCILTPICVVEVLLDILCWFDFVTFFGRFMLAYNTMTLPGNFKGADDKLNGILTAFERDQCFLCSLVTSCPVCFAIVLAIPFRGRIGKCSASHQIYSDGIFIVVVCDTNGLQFDTHVWIWF